MAGKGTILEFPWFTMKYEKLEDGDQSSQIGFPAILRFDSSLHEFAGSHMSDVLLVSTHFLKRWPFLEFLSGSSSSCNYFLVAHADAWHWQGWMVGVGQIGRMVVLYITVKGDVIPKNHLVVTSNDWRKENIGNCVASITPVFQQKTQVGMSHCN